MIVETVPGEEIPCEGAGPDDDEDDDEAEADDADTTRRAAEATLSDESA
jgi:hypothetical protein